MSNIVIKPSNQLKFRNIQVPFIDMSTLKNCFFILTLKHFICLTTLNMQTSNTVTVPFNHLQFKDTHVKVPFIAM